MMGTVHVEVHVHVYMHMLCTFYMYMYMCSSVEICVYTCIFKLIRYMYM